MSKRRIDWQKVIIYMQDELFFSQQEITEACNVAQQSVSNWRNMVRVPAPAVKRKLTRIIGYPGRCRDKY